jgi:hypothetical protein
VVEDEDNSEEDEIVEGFERFRTMRIIFFCGMSSARYHKNASCMSYDASKG